MGSTFSIRLPEQQRRALRDRARAMNATESAWVRRLIERDLQQSSLKQQLSGLIGSLEAPQASSACGAKGHPLKEHIRRSNWRG
jgi:hypothetical protein